MGLWVHARSLDWFRVGLVSAEFGWVSGWKSLVGRAGLVFGLVYGLGLGVGFFGRVYTFNWFTPLACANWVGPRNWLVHFAWMLRL